MLSLRCAALCLALCWTAAGAQTAAAPKHSEESTDAVDLLPRYRKCRRIVLRLNEFAEASRPGDIGALTDVDEERVLGDHERLESRQPHRGLVGDRLTHGLAVHRVHDGCDVGRRRAAASTDGDAGADSGARGSNQQIKQLSLIHISEPTRPY